MASLFVCGNLRDDKQMTGVQEYGTILTKNNKEVKGRPDIFIKTGTSAVWIECKYEKNIRSLGDEHWDLPAWLAWDKEFVFNQVGTYYEFEKKTINKSYQQHYLMTLCFKVIKEDPSEHNNKVTSELESRITDVQDRIWYYQVGFLDEGDKSHGIEVYGTCFQMELAVSPTI